MVECWAGAPPTVIGDGHSNDLTFCTVALESQFESRQISLMLESMEERDDLLMGIRWGHRMSLSAHSNNIFNIICSLFYSLEIWWHFRL